MLRNINKTLEAEKAEFKLAKRDTMSATGKRESSIDNHSDDED
jgi:hypothetical protein